jgi:hypothetical protein
MYLHVQRANTPKSCQGYRLKAQMRLRSLEATSEQISTLHIAPKNRAASPVVTQELDGERVENSTLSQKAEESNSTAHKQGTDDPVCYDGAQSGAAHFTNGKERQHGTFQKSPPRNKELPLPSTLKAAKQNQIKL